MTTLLANTNLQSDLIDPNFFKTENYHAFIKLIYNELIYIEEKKGGKEKLTYYELTCNKTKAYEQYVMLKDNVKFFWNYAQESPSSLQFNIATYTEYKQIPEFQRIIFSKCFNLAYAEYVYDQ